MRARTRLGGAVAVAGAAALLGLAVGGPPAGAASSRPNVVVILTDDQTADELSPTAMPLTYSMIKGGGTEFSRFYTNYPICCPSRATLLSGQYMHNHHVRGNVPPLGGHEEVRARGSETTWLPTWLNTVGYDTAHVGKYLNGYGDDGKALVPPGWDEWYGQLSDFDRAEIGGKLYYNYRLLEKGMVGPAVETSYGSSPADYQTDVLQEKALGVLDDFNSSSNPFYLEFAVSAPHYPFIPALKYAGTMSAAPLPPLLGLNEKDISDKPAFLREDARGRLKAATLATLFSQRRMRLEQLRSVDDAVGALLAKLATQGKLANTYVIFNSDNGYFFGEHRIIAGKYLPYEPSSRVPFVIRGPGVPSGTTSAELSSNADVAPTIAAIAGASPTLPVDGRNLLPFATNPAARSDRPLLLEADIGPGTGTRRLSARRRARARTLARLGLAGAQGVENLEQESGAHRFAANGDRAPAYKSIRTNRYLLTIYSSGEIELYDMAKDPGQLTSLGKNKRYAKVRKVLLRRLLTLASCQAATCNSSYGNDPKPLPKHGKRGKQKGAKGKKEPAA
ncbi:MAG: sulfatase family protein [Solirubrobacterales bacterium]